MSKELNEDGFVPGQPISPEEHARYLAKQRIKEREAKRVKTSAPAQAKKQPAKKQPAKRQPAKKQTESKEG